MYDYESLSVRKIGFFLLKNSLAYEMRVLLARPLIAMWNWERKNYFIKE